jgi:hypothetical protein
VRTLSLRSIILFLLALCIQKSVQAGESRIDYLLRTLETAPDYKVRIAAATELGKKSDGTVADWILRAFRKEKNAAVRLATLYGVGHIPDALIIPPLLELMGEELLSDQEILIVEKIIWNFRSAIAKYLWAAALLESSDLNERATGAYLFGIVGDSSVLPMLSYGMKDPSATVRKRSIQAIGRIGSRDGLALCKKALSDADATVRRVADTCIGEIQMASQGSVPKNYQRRVDLKIDLYGLQKDGMTPKLMQAYLKRNMNPRALDVALAALRSEKSEDRADKSIQLIRGDDSKNSLKFNVRIFTMHDFPKADLNRLREVVKDNVGYVNQCYVTALKRDKKLSGEVTTQFIVLSSGAVSTVDILESTLPDKSVDPCIRERVKTLKFPEIPLKFVTMKYTFTFVPPKDEIHEFGDSAVSAEQRKPGLQKRH